jgi:hypothetical protein
MEVTKSLGVRYIWIDSLCIIQDSDEDWRREATRMSRVYEHSICNIAATRATDGNVGCFMEKRSLMEVVPCRVYLAWMDQPAKAYYCYDVNLYYRFLLRAPLSKRAWFVQELALAPRVVHFADGQMWWECVERRACESFPQRVPYDLVTRGKISADVAKLPFVRSDRNGKTRSRSDLWIDIVQAYSGADLTYPEKDELAAISGLARKFGPPEDYFAGLWKWDFEAQLFWSAAWNGGKTARVPSYHNPSWSWTSMSGGIFHPLGMGPSSSFQILDFPIANEDDPYGRLADPCLRLAGGLVRTQLNITDQGDYFGTAGCAIFKDEGNSFHGETFFALPRDCGDSDIRGLLLTPTFEKKGEYTRLGYFHIWSCKDDFRALCREPLVPGDDTRTQLYEKRLEDSKEGYPRYIISII